VFYAGPAAWNGRSREDDNQSRRDLISVSAFRSAAASIGSPAAIASTSAIIAACGDPACGGAETVILVMRPGRRTEAAKLMKPLATVTEEELIPALAPLAGPEVRSA
jgi:hypothetical protein